MLNSISGLLTPAAQPSPRFVAQVSTESGTRLPVAQTPARANDGFSIAVGTNGAADIGALTGARRNAEQGASLLQSADDGLGEISDALIRMKDLAALASSTTSPLSRGERAILNNEFEVQRAEINRIADRTEFNSTKILKGTQLAFKVGTGNASEDSITVSLAAATVVSLDAGLASDTIADASAASQALIGVTSAIDALKGIQASVDGAAVRFQAVQRNLTSDRSILSTLRTDFLVRPVTIGTADNLANLVSQEFLSHAAPVAAGQLSSALRVLTSTSRLAPLELLQADDRSLSQENAQTKAVKRPSAYEAGQDTRLSSHSEPSHSVDIKA